MDLPFDPQAFAHAVPFDRPVAQTVVLGIGADAVIAEIAFCEIIGPACMKRRSNDDRAVTVMFLPQCSCVHEIFIGVGRTGLRFSVDRMLPPGIGEHGIGFSVFVFYASSADDQQGTGILFIQPKSMIHPPSLHAAERSVRKAGAAQHKGKVIVRMLLSGRSGKKVKEDDRSCDKDAHKASDDDR